MYHKIPTSTYGNGQGISSRQWQPWRFRASRRPSRFVRQIFEEGSIRMLLSHFCKQECLRIRNVYACNPSRKYPEEIHCFSNCQQLQRAQKPYFMEIFASELSTIHSETLMDMSSARELEGKSSIEGLGHIFIAQQDAARIDRSSDRKQCHELGSPLDVMQWRHTQIRMKNIPRICRCLHFRKWKEFGVHRNSCEGKDCYS